MKKLLPPFVFFIMMLALPAFTKAAEPAVYPTPIYVSVQKTANVTIKLNSEYQLVNNQTNERISIPGNTSLAVKLNGGAVAVSYSGVTQSSTSGFLIQELANPTTTPVASLSNGNSYRGSFHVKASGSYVEVVNFLDLEEYVKGVVPNEMPASWHKEALKTQVIATRSYAAATKTTLSSTASSQVYRGYDSEDARSNAAVEETRGLMVKFAGKPIQALFYSTSGGRTANYGDVWNPRYASSYPYFVSVEDTYENSPFSNWSVTVSADVILKSFGFSSTDTLLDMKLQATGKNGEVSGVYVKTSSGEKTITGTEGEIRRLFPVGTSANYNILYSNWFTMSPKLSDASSLGLTLSVQTTSGTESVVGLKGRSVKTASGTVTLDDSNVTIQTASGKVLTSGSSASEITSVTLKGKGFGHRLGMSQYGAKGFAEHGWTAERILAHYYPGTTVGK